MKKVVHRVTRSSLWSTPRGSSAQRWGNSLAVRIPKSFAEEVGLAILCPLTNQVPDGLPVEGVVLADQAKSLDWRARGAESLCTLPPESTSAVLERLETLVVWKLPT